MPDTLGITSSLLSLQRLKKTKLEEATPRAVPVCDAGKNIQESIGTITLKSVLNQY
jgi:hypothetical protein